MKNPKTFSEILIEIIREDERKQLLADAVYNRKHNDIEYTMIRQDLVYEAIKRFSQQHMNFMNKQHELIEKQSQLLVEMKNMICAVLDMVSELELPDDIKKILIEAQIKIEMLD